MSISLLYTLTRELDPTLGVALTFLGMRFQCGTSCSDTGNIERINANEKITPLEITLSRSDKGYKNCSSKICPQYAPLHPDLNLVVLQLKRN